MSAPAAVGTLDVAAYLALEEGASTKHEYLRGVVHAMAGGTPEHGALALAFASRLAVALRGRPCRLFSSDVRIRVDETDLFTYPDFSVVCGALATASIDRNAITNPMVIVEILSPGTEAYDRGAKMDHYRRLASLREYVLVNHDRHQVEVFRRNEAGRFEQFVFGKGEAVELASLGVNVDVDGVYEDPLASG
jgi:Uma2 family endonuclease